VYIRWSNTTVIDDDFVGRPPSSLHAPMLEAKSVYVVTLGLQFKLYLVCNFAVTADGMCRAYWK